MERQQKVIGQLPADAAETLRRAARTPVTAKDPLARIKAIDRAAEIVKHKYPEYFKE